MGYVQKAIYFFRKEGIASTAGRIVRKLWTDLLHAPCAALERILIRRYVRQIADKACGKTVYVLLSCFEWNLPLHQRPHQIAKALSCQYDAYTVFVSDEYRYDNFPGILQINDRLDVVSKRIVNHFDTALAQAKEVTVFKCWPIQEAQLNSFSYDRLVYEYIDDLSILPYCTPEIVDIHHELMKRADLTVCTSRALSEEAAHWSHNVLLSRNAADYAFLAGMRGCAPEPGLARRVEGYDCVLGYYGCIAEWMDYAVILDVARRKPNWCFVLVGSEERRSADVLRRSKADNIFLYPAQEYANLPHFVAAFDIQLIPFCLSRLTRAVSPVKLFEYMANGKPILTSAMPECMDYGCVAVYADAEDFVAQVNRLLTLSGDSGYLSLIDEEGRKNTWDIRVKEILARLEETR